jgi:hypothetical protein
MKTINKLFAIVTISLFIMSCSSDDDDTTQETQNVFEKLQGNTYRQVETPDSCNDCEDEINYYSFSADNLTITGTELDGTCEQYDVIQIGECSGCATILENTPDKFVVTYQMFIFTLKYTITFNSDGKVQFVFDSGLSEEVTWTSNLWTDTIPDCTDYSD